MNLSSLSDLLGDWRLGPLLAASFGGVANVHIHLMMKEYHADGVIHSPSLKGLRP